VRSSDGGGAGAERAGSRAGGGAARRDGARPERGSKDRICSPQVSLQGRNGVQDAARRPEGVIEGVDVLELPIPGTEALVRSRYAHTFPEATVRARRTQLAEDLRGSGVSGKLKYHYY
jgi:hypothetical protein